MSALVALGTVEGKRIEFGGALVLLGLDGEGTWKREGFHWDSHFMKTRLV